MSIFSGMGSAAAREITMTDATLGHKMIDLARGDVIIEPPVSICEGAISAVHARAHRDTDSIGFEPLRRAVAEKLSAGTDIDWSMEEIAIAPGAKQALLDAVSAVLDPGDEVIVIRPYWSKFPSQVLLAGGTPVFVDARRPRYIPAIGAIRAAVTPRTKAIILNSPNNPTGAVYDRTTLQNIGELALDRQLWIISDECYSSFVFTGVRRHQSIVMAHPGVRSRTILLNAFSNELAITGWRLAYLAAPAPIISAARTLQSRTTASPNMIAQHAVLHHLQVSDGSFESEMYQRLVDARNSGLHILSDLRDVAPPRADGSFFFYFDLGRLISSLPIEGPIGSADEIARLLLEEARVRCVAGGAFGDVNGLRVSFGAPPDLLEAGLKRIVDTLNSLRMRQAGL
ncbi:aminotransferase class I/II-fold pyridoxal phosphate-dependent enzyme [Bradyrhizobium sp. 142]|uniref:pyridoxal phosphate-dependent aminotransferase n=1 Tax=Bradyrhizobium sp. 142 TaxID=2782618 RepID=UPI001FF7A98A|nr:aminotransferase class I/II-fold pyridoxal phosphate-dependent enzyme [Bradyrhizobium sp. 142]